MTVAASQGPPFGVGTLRTLSWAAMALADIPTSSARIGPSAQQLSQLPRRGDGPRRSGSKADLWRDASGPPRASSRLMHLSKQGCDSIMSGSGEQCLQLLGVSFCNPIKTAET